MAVFITDPDADFSANPAGFVGPYTSNTDVLGLFDLRGSFERARVNHAVFGGEPALRNLTGPTYTPTHIETDAIGELIFPHAPVSGGSNTIFGIFEIHRTGGSLPQAPFGISPTSPNLNGQILLANGPNFIRAYTYVRPAPYNFLVNGTQKFASYTIPTNGSLDNDFLFVAATFESEVGINIYIPSVSGATPVGTQALVAGEFIAFNPALPLQDRQYRANGFATTLQKTGMTGYAPGAMSGAALLALYDEMKPFYGPTI